MSVIINGTTGETTPAVIYTGSSSGSITVQATATAGSNTLTLPAVTGTVLASSGGTITVPAGSGTVAVQGLSTNIVPQTAVTLTTQTSVTFGSIPSWVNRITFILSAVQNTSGSQFLIQLGSGSTQTTGYSSFGGRYSGGGATSSSVVTTGFIIFVQDTNQAQSGQYVFTRISGNTWIGQYNGAGIGGTNQLLEAGGTVTISSAVDRLVFTSSTGTDVYKSGTINIFYE